MMLRQFSTLKAAVLCPFVRTKKGAGLSQLSEENPETGAKVSCKGVASWIRECVIYFLSFPPSPSPKKVILAKGNVFSPGETLPFPPNTCHVSSAKETVANTLR